MKKDEEPFVQREETMVKRMWVEIPNDKKELFEEKFCQLCAELSVRLF